MGSRIMRGFGQLVLRKFARVGVNVCVMGDRVWEVLAIWFRASVEVWGQCVCMRLG